MPQLPAQPLPAQPLDENDRSITGQIARALAQRIVAGLLPPGALPRLIATIDDLHQVGARFLFATWKELEWQPRSDDEHRAIMSAVRKRNARGAIAALSEHILAAGRALAAMLATAQQAPRG